MCGRVLRPLEQPPWCGICCGIPILNQIVSSPALCSVWFGCTQMWHPTIRVGEAPTPRSRARQEEQHLLLLEPMSVSARQPRHPEPSGPSGHPQFPRGLRAIPSSKSWAGNWPRSLPRRPEQIAYSGQRPSSTQTLPLSLPLAFGDPRPLVGGHPRAPKPVFAPLNPSLTRDQPGPGRPLRSAGRGGQVAAAARGAAGAGAPDAAEKRSTIDTSLF